MNVTTYQTDITGLSHEGRGVAHIEGKTTFLTGGLPGETVEFVYLKRRSQFDEGQVTRLLKASPDRDEPVCPHFGLCGGCRLQHQQHAAQVHTKQQSFLEQLRHIGGIEPGELLPPLIGPSTGYRHRARLGVKFVPAKNKVLVGFHEINGRYLADMDSCSVLHPAVGERLSDLATLVRSLEAYRTIPQIEVSMGDTAIALLFRHLQPLSDLDLQLLRSFGQENDWQIHLQPGGLDSVHCLYPCPEPPLLSYRLADLELCFQPTDFTQVNPYINRLMVAQALQLLQPQPEEILLDLFCGIGNFTLPLAQRCQKVIGIEGQAKAVLRATANAQHNQITNAEFFVGDLTQDNAWFRHRFDKILLDPPRTGAWELVKLIPALQPNTILYVSCNPATLARDSKELCQHGYRMVKAGVIDMFPHTSHIESMALFEQR